MGALEAQAIADLKRQFIRKLETVKRVGVDKLIVWLQESDFFEAPCSRKHHLAEPGGLVEHSLNVQALLTDKVAQFCPDRRNVDSDYICGLLHDVCKVGTYVVDEEPITDPQEYKLKGCVQSTVYAKFKEQKLTKAWASDLIDHYVNKRQGPPPDKKIAYKIEDQLPMGHGEKSVSIIQDFIKLTEEEKLAIRWHMSAFNIGTYGELTTYNEALKTSPLVALLFAADFEATHIIEREGEWSNAKE